MSRTPRRRGENSDGLKMRAITSMPSTRRGPGRLVSALPSIAQTSHAAAKLHAVRRAAARLIGRALHAVAARREEDDVRFRAATAAARPPASGRLRRERIDAAGAPDHLGHPMTAGEEGVGPFDHRHARPRRARSLERVVHGADPRVQSGEEFLSLVARRSRGPPWRCRRRRRRASPPRARRPAAPAKASRRARERRSPSRRRRRTAPA